MSNGWVEVGEEAAAQVPYKFWRPAALGDQFIGKLTRILEGVKGTYGTETHYLFVNPDGEFAVNPNHDLRKRYTAISIGDIVRTTYVSDLDLGKKNPDGSSQSPMKKFRVEKFTGAVPATSKTDF